jgi:hypothetical protein
VFISQTLKYFGKLCRNEKQQYEFSKTNANHAIQSRKTAGLTRVYTKAFANEDAQLPKMRKEKKK